MDFLFTRDESEDSIQKHDVFDTKYSGGLLDENWTNPNDLLDSIFSMDNDFLNDYDHTKNFETLDDLSEHIKMEAEEYEMSVPSLNSSQQNPSDDGMNCNNTADEKQHSDNEFSHIISSNSSDSGLSSENLDIEMSPVYEPLSPAVSSPGPSISESGEKKDYLYESEIDVCNNSPPRLSSSSSIESTVVIQNPKVIVKKIPQIITLPNHGNKIFNTTTAAAAASASAAIISKTNPPQKIKFANNKDFKIVKLSPQMLTTTTTTTPGMINNKKVTIQVKNSNTGAKLQTSPGTFFINNGKLTEVKKLVRVQNISNPRSVLLPVSIQDVKDLKAFKIINSSNLKAEMTKVNTTNVQKTTYTNKNINRPKTTTIRNNGKLPEDSLSDNTSDAESYIYEDINSNVSPYDVLDDNRTEGQTTNSPYPKLILTSEEKRLLSKEGITLPTHYPLTKHEERELKRIRRKIRNKISAQDSRKRKKEYVDGLEERVKQCTEENQTLMKRIKLLQNQNQNLMSQMKKLQTLLSKGTNKTAQPTTCLMVLLLSLALIAAPNLKLGQNPKEGELEEAVQDTILQNRRNLLFDSNTQNSDILDEEINMSEIFSSSEFNAVVDNCKSFSLISNSISSSSSNSNSNSGGTGNSYEPHCKKPKFIDFDVDDMNWYQSKEVENLQKSQSAFNQLAQEFQEKKKAQQQTSGFNINDNNASINKDLLDKDDVLEKMLSSKSNGVYNLNIDKLMDLHNGDAIFDVTANYVYQGKQTDEKLNSSELRHVQKY